MNNLSQSFQRVISLAKLIVIDGLRRYALIGLIIFALAGCTGGLLFFDFIPREIGRATSDFLFTIMWLTGLIFLFFHAVQIVAWDNERGAIHAYLARPISRTEYALAIFAGLAFLLLMLNIILGLLGWVLLLFVKSSVKAVYFTSLSSAFFFLAVTGLYFLELIILAVLLFFSSVVRGSLTVFLLTLCYYFICSGLPVVRNAYRQELGVEGHSSLEWLLQGLTFLFPDFSNLDYKTLVTTTDLSPAIEQIIISFGSAAFYIVLVLWLACYIYSLRDLQ